jgi:predicted PurR-regulated permease PerM
MLALALFVGLVVLFRHLIVLLVFFVAFERPLAAAADRVAARLGLSRRAAVGLVALVVLALLGGALAVGVGRAVRQYVAVRGSLPDRVAAFRDTPLYQRIAEHLHGADRVLESAREYATHALHYLSALGHTFVYVVIGFILAVVFELERDELEGFARSVDARSFAGTLLRWLAYLADAMWVTLTFQVIVAACNAVLTFPVLLLVGIPHATTFVFMIFASGMVPVVGNFVAGAVLSLLAYQARGWLGVGIFVGLTFVLHKLESYYLNPRLAARHVRLPGFVLIVSLILWEHLFSFVGLFLSFPFLYVAARMRSEFRVEDQAAIAAAAGVAAAPRAEPPAPAPAPTSASTSASTSGDATRATARLKKRR